MYRSTRSIIVVAVTEPTESSDLTPVGTRIHVAAPTRDCGHPPLALSRFMIIAVSRSRENPVGLHSVVATWRLKNCGHEIEKSS